MKKIYLSTLVLFLVACGGGETTTQSGAEPNKNTQIAQPNNQPAVQPKPRPVPSSGGEIGRPTKPKDCGNDCPPVFPKIS